MELLPPDLLDAVCAALTGFELFQLSHASARLRQLLSTEQVWLRYFPQCVTESATEVAGDMGLFWKRIYMRSRSLQFEGRAKWSSDAMEIDTSVAEAHGLFLPVRRLPTLTSLWQPAASLADDFGPAAEFSSIGIDTWFSLEPGGETVYSGGVILGGQSSYAGSTMSPSVFQPFILVDASCSLYCSVVDQDVQTAEPVTSNLVVHRWYHLALSYSGKTRQEQVFLDGKLVASRVGDWHRDWRRLSYSQIGTGCVSAGSNRCFPTPNYTGWYGFHGVIDEFRVWRRALTEKEVQLIAAGTALPGHNVLWWYAIAVGNGMAFESLALRLVRCTRPCERGYQLPVR